MRDLLFSIQFANPLLLFSALAGAVLILALFAQEEP